MTLLSNSITTCLLYLAAWKRTSFTRKNSTNYFQSLFHRGRHIKPRQTKKVMTMTHLYGPPRSLVFSLLYYRRLTGSEQSELGSRASSIRLNIRLWVLYGRDAIGKAKSEKFKNTIQNDIRFTYQQIIMSLPFTSGQTIRVHLSFLSLELISGIDFVKCEHWLESSSVASTWTDEYCFSTTILGVAKSISCVHIA